MKVGDLICHLHETGKNSFWNEPAVIIKGPYEHSATTEIAGTCNRLTEVYMAIDILHKGRIWTGLKIENFIKTEKMGDDIKTNCDKGSDFIGNHIKNTP
tara:strand:+ start:8616 stop:8912 length:297 start_codon:yes stop_codon:yes gene_type:complete